MQSRVNRLLDPKVRAILAQIDKEGARKRKEKEDNSMKPPPKTFDEFLKYYNLADWPERVLQEQDSGKAARALVLGSQDDIEGILMDAAPLALDMLTKLEDRLTQLEEVLQSYAKRIITDGEDKDADQDDRPFLSPNRTFLTETAEAHARSLVSTMSISQKSQQDYAERLLERKKKTVENGIFPGFRPKELVELPAQIESPPILHRVTKAQDFNAGFKKFWKKIFLSEASVAVMQDTFWWIFIDKFKKAPRKEKQVDKDLLFDRIADSFVALFHSINTDVKDKFLMAYPGCLAQALFITFCESYPESKTQFDSDCFKQYLVDLVFEWTSGIKVLPGLYKSWDVPRLLRKGGKGQDSVEAAKQMLEAKQNADKKNSRRHSMDITGFERMLSKLEENVLGEMSREPTQLTGTTMTGHVTKPGQSQQSSVKVVPGLDEEESHQIGPGADLERVKFNLQGRSPLVAHYLHKRQLKSFDQAGKKVRRTEVVALPAPGLTYREVINNTLSLSETLSLEYHKICERTNAEIMDLEKKKKDTNREIDKLQRELLFTKNSIEMKILSDKIMAIKDRDKNKSFFAAEAAAGQAIALDSEEDEEEDLI